MWTEKLYLGIYMCVDIHSVTRDHVVEKETMNLKNRGRGYVGGLGGKKGKGGVL